MKAASDPLEWAGRAEEDYQLARLSIQRKTPLTYGATFHAQQCAEKYIKALLILRKIDFPRIHDLSALFVLCSQNGIIIPIAEDDLDRLNAYAVAVRYPGEQPTIEEARQAIETARKIRKFGRKTLGLIKR